MEISISTVIVSKYIYSAMISTISLDRLLLMQPMLLMIGANAPAGSDDRIGRITTVPSELISGNEVCVLVIPTIVCAHLSFSLLMHCRGRPSLMSAVVNASNFDRSPRTNARLSRRHLACLDQHQSVLVSQKEGLLISKRAVSVPPPPWHQLSLWSGR